MREDPRQERRLTAGLEGFFGIQGNASLSLILLTFLGPFVATLEVFSRKKMGERYFTRMNFIAGWFVLAIASTIGGFTEDAFLGAVFTAYFVMGFYHFFVQWWQNKTRNWMHSMYGGDTRLEWLGTLLIGGINALLAIPVKLFGKALPEAEQQKLEQALPIFKDVRSLTYSIVEPLFFIVLGIILLTFGSTASGTWMLISAVALWASNALTEELAWHQMLNIRDRRIESEFMRTGMPEDSGKIKFPKKVREAIKEFAEEAAEDPEIFNDIQMASPSIADAMAAINPNLGKEETPKTDDSQNDKL